MFRQLDKKWRIWLIDYRQTIKQPRNTPLLVRIILLSFRVEQDHQIHWLNRCGRECEIYQQALEAELSEYLKGFESHRLKEYRCTVDRNGYHPERDIPIGIGLVTVKVPKTRSKQGKQWPFLRIGATLVRHAQWKQPCLYLISINHTFDHKPIDQKDFDPFSLLWIGG